MESSSSGLQIIDQSEEGSGEKNSGSDEKSELNTAQKNKTPFGKVTKAIASLKKTPGWLNTINSVFSKERDE